MTRYEAYVDGNYVTYFDTVADAETLAYWMGEGQTLCVVES